MNETLVSAHFLGFHGETCIQNREYSNYESERWKSWKNPRKSSTRTPCKEPARNWLPPLKGKLFETDSLAFAVMGDFHFFMNEIKRNSAFDPSNKVLSFTAIGYNKFTTRGCVDISPVRKPCQRDCPSLKPSPLCPSPSSSQPSC